MRNILLITGFFIAAYTGIALVVILVFKITKRGIFNDTQSITSKS